MTSTGKKKIRCAGIWDTNFSMEDKPLCPYFGDCGGCTAQHIRYDIQLQNKKNLVATHLRKNGIEAPEPAVFFGKPYSYRNRMDFAFCREGAGLRRKDSGNSILPIAGCPISNSRINELLAELNAWLEKNPEIEPFEAGSCRGTMKYAVIRAAEFSDSTAISFLVDSGSPEISRHILLIEEFAKKSKAKNIAVGKISAKSGIGASFDHFAVKGGLSMEEAICGRKIAYSAFSFFQNNSAMAEKMAEYCRKIFEKHETKNAALIDLYGGAGTFGACLGKNFAKTIVIDNEPLNIRCARGNLLNNGIKNAEAVCADAGCLPRLKLNKMESFVIADPPRTGLGQKTIKRLMDLSPKLIIYISCSPVQMAKELRFFRKNYAVASTAVFDLFPQTVHTEAIAELARK